MYTVCTHSDLPKKRADQNKRIWGDFFFNYYIKWKMRVWWQIFSFDTWKIDGWEKNPKKLSEHARYTSYGGSSEYYLGT